MRLLGEPRGELLPAVVQALHDALAAGPQLLGAHLRAPLRHHQQVLQRDAPVVRMVILRLRALAVARPRQHVDEVPREDAQLAVHLLLEADELGPDGADELLRGGAAEPAAAHHLAHRRHAAAAAPRAQLVREALHLGNSLPAPACGAQDRAEPRRVHLPPDAVHHCRRPPSRAAGTAVLLLRIGSDIL